MKLQKVVFTASPHRTYARVQPQEKSTARSINSRPRSGKRLRGFILDKISSDHFLKALVSSYVWVASRGDVSLSELHKYEQAIVQSPFATQFNPENMRHYFKDMVSLFEQNEAYATQLTQERIQEYRDQQPYANEIVRLCRTAIVADASIADAEETVLKEIETLLGLTPDDL